MSQRRSYGFGSTILHRANIQYRYVFLALEAMRRRFLSKRSSDTTNRPRRPKSSRKRIMAKEQKSNISKPTMDQVMAATRGIPFGTCKQCGLRTITTAVLCPECERLMDIGFGPVPRAPYARPGQDTQPAQSNPSDNRSGYSDTIPGPSPRPGTPAVPDKTSWGHKD